jgi:alpha-glucosidase
LFSTGIETRLDYIKDLGVGAIWLSPIYKSPMKDFGYDIQDFRDVDPAYGTMDDFHSLVKAVKEKGTVNYCTMTSSISTLVDLWNTK